MTFKGKYNFTLVAIYVPLKKSKVKGNETISKHLQKWLKELITKSKTNNQLIIIISDFNEYLHPQNKSTTIKKIDPAYLKK